MIFAQLGNDVVQGDGSIEVTSTGGVRVGASRNASGYLVINPSFEAASDGDDYIEGGGGRDLLFGGLGRDDLIGGSSDLYSLTTMGRRPDVSDVIFGGAGTDIGRNDDTSLHGVDSDTIVGDNGNILRLVAVSAGVSSYRTFTYDTYGSTGGEIRLLPRAVVLLDYTPGGPDSAPSQFPGTTNSSAAGTGVVDIWGLDEAHGESGDDTIYLGGGNDVAFGDAGDDDIIGGWGHDWLSGGTGVDGLLGDDGRILTSRNGSSEPLNGVATARTQITINTPGKIQTATLYPSGQLNKSADLTPFALDGNLANPLFVPGYANDVIFGGWDGDFIHAGSGDDAVSGAEAQLHSYAPTYTLLPNNGGLVASGLIETGWSRPFNDGSLLGFDLIRGAFNLYDEYDPKRLILLLANGTLSKTGAGAQWFLNHLNEGRSSGTGVGILTDGDDVAFGDHGHDWISGGTGRDTLWGGWGNDLLNADDILTTSNGLNDTPDTNTSYEDRAYGGAGLDILIGNTGGDRLIDFVGEFNSYIVPFSPFGINTVSRQLMPGLPEFLLALATAQGLDRTLVGALDASYARGGEPFGEMGIVLQQDDAWQAQTGGPRDPQPGTVPGGPRDVLRSATFGSTATLDGFFVDSGSFTISAVRSRWPRPAWAWTPPPCSTSTTTCRSTTNSRPRSRCRSRLAAGRRTPS
ncbi:MAG: hypothetical protein IPL43_02565 [Micropruina sp.]|nr:hypothetical protein [Micropruina sp.]